MKNLNIKLTILIILISATNLYSQNGLETVAYFTGGGTQNFPTKENMKYIEGISAVRPLGFIKGTSGLSLNGVFQTGFYLDFKGTFSGMSFLLDTSFSYVDIRSSSVVTNMVNAGTNYNKVITKTSYFSIGTGAIIKFHFFKNFSLGIGGGVYITPFDYTLAFERTSANESTNNTASTIISSPTKFVPYAKATFEYSLFFTGNLTMRFGGYFSFELPNIFLPNSATSPGTLSPYLNAGALIGVGYLFRYY